MTISNFNRILILRGGAIGDFVLTLPAIRAIRERFPSAHIRLFGHPHVTELAVGRGYADSAWRLDDPAFAPLFAPTNDHPQTSLGVAPRSDTDHVGEGLRSHACERRPDKAEEANMRSSTRAEEFEAFDLIVGFWKDDGDVLAGNLARVCPGRIVMHDPTPPGDPKRHAADHVCGVLPRIGIEAADATPKLFPTCDDLSQADKFFRSQAEPGNEGGLDPAKTIAIHPGSGGRTKNWPVERFAEIVKRIAVETDWHVLLTYGPADEEVAHDLNELLAASTSRRDTPKRVWGWHTASRGAATNQRRGGTPLPPRSAEQPRTGEGAETLPYNEAGTHEEKRRGGTPFPPPHGGRAANGEGAETLPYDSADEDMVGEMRELLTKRVPPPNSFGGAWARDLPLPILAAILSRCRAYLGNDSGITHIAAAVGAPTLAVFGPTDPDVWGPRGSSVEIVRGRAPCAPCSREERLRCERRRCMESVSVDEVWGRLRRLSSR